MRPAFAVLFALISTPAVAEDPALVAPTGPRTPAEERAGFTVPDGFEVQLVAAEPDIQKPIQMAFDAKGRLWVTTSYHYPFASEGTSTDKLFILSDFGLDGWARKVETFAADLNIPIGILPLPDCQSCIVSSVGEILKLTDTDGDGKADKREVLFKGFGTRDTHGMTNSFTLLPDGWVYACHGFANDSRVKGTDGHEVVMNSGHTFRFRPDGSRIEVVTRGQVNPFGIAVDPWFNLYTADCHSKPITQVIPGAYYDSFGKPHDGLGYAPHVTRHDHGSTGLCGLTWYDADHFPARYKGCMFLGNVVTNRINFDKIEWKGSTPVAKELPDFLTSKDPWFRPADIKLGPDGALYVTDFYNKIIGHYEVDLKHPGRDKDRGRVWRIVWKGRDALGESTPGFPPKPPFADLTRETVGAVDDLLSHPNLTVRLLATHELIHRGRQNRMKAARERAAAGKRAAEVYAAHREWADVAADFPGRLVDLGRTEFTAAHAYRIERAQDEWFREQPEHLKRLQPERRAVIYETGGHPIRARVELMAAVPRAEYVKELVELLPAIPADNTHLSYAARIALRNCLRDAKGGWEAAAALADKDVKALAVLLPAALGVREAAGAKFLAEQFDVSQYSLARHPAAGIPADRFVEAVEFVGRYGDDPARNRLTGSVFHVADTPARVDLALDVALALGRGARASGRPMWTTLPDDTRNVLDIALRAGGDPARARRAVQLVGLILDTTTDGPSVTFVKTTRVNALRNWMRNPDAPVEVRAEAFEVAVRHFMAELVGPIGEVLADGAAPAALRERVALTLAGNPKALDHAGPRDGIRAVLKPAPYRYQAAVAQALAGSLTGAEVLFKAVRLSEASPRLLQDRQVLEKLRAVGVQNLDQKVAELTKGLPPADQKTADLIRQRAGKLSQVKADAAEGAKVFAKNCAACHRVGDVGGKVAPQLDGVGIRGAERLLEDTLDPNRNVDAAFRARVLTLTDGTTKTGLMLRVDGGVVVFADAEGKEFRVPAADIEANRETALSPMPANFGETIPEAEFFHLLAYLLAQKAKDPPKP